MSANDQRPSHSFGSVLVPFHALGDGLRRSDRKVARAEGGRPGCPRCRFDSTALFDPFGEPFERVLAHSLRIGEAVVG